MAVSKERRRLKRFQVDFPGMVQVGARTHPVIVSDLATGGAIVTTKEPISALVSADIILINFSRGKRLADGSPELIEIAHQRSPNWSYCRRM